MATKQIQLRGISRTPSDRLTNDGGCAESLNVQLDNTELAPMFYPENVTAKKGLPANLQAESVFIHKTANYENYIVELSDRIVAYTPDIEDKEPLLVYTKSEGESIESITSVGNTLIIVTKKTMYYFLFKDRAYGFLDESMPIPQLDIYAEPEEGDYASASLGLDFWLDRYDTKEEWNNSSDEYLIGLTEKVWEDNNNSLKNTIVKEFSKGYFISPRFFQCVIELNAGTPIVSLPVLVGSGPQFMPYVHADWTRYRDEDQGGGTTDNISTNAYLKYRRHKVKAILRNLKDFEPWKDIITNIKIYVGEYLYLKAEYKKDKKLNLHTLGGGESQDGSEEEIYGKFYFDDTLPNTREILQKEGVTYLCKTFPMTENYKFSEEIEELAKGITIEASEEFKSEKLATKEYIAPNDFTNYPMFPEKVENYNNRLLALSPTYFASYMHHGLGATVKMDALETTYEIYFKCKAVTKDIVFKADITAKDIQYCGLIFCPDASCTKMTIKATRGNKTKYLVADAVPHPNLPCSYVSLHNSIYYFEDLYDSLGEEVKTLPQIDSKSEKDNGLWISPINEPFVFLPEGKFTFQSKVMKVAVATTALSQGQFGQFPLYVFSEDGIWAMETAADGSFVSNKPLLREVCINPDSVISIDNAVVFVTAQGVMLLQGSQVANISPFMNGRHYTIEDSAKILMTAQKGFKDFIPIVDDETHFLAFVKAAKTVYDYAGKRIIFIKEGEDYQYVYKIDTQTWHKSAYGVNVYAPINAYPECLVLGDTGKTLTLLNITSTSKAQYGVYKLAELFAENWGDKYGLTADGLLPVFRKEDTLDITHWSKEDTTAMERFLTNERVEYEYVSSQAKSILDFSTVVDAEESKTPTKGVIATRPLNLGEPDVFKTITDIRIRGQYSKGAVKFILLGSNDGVTFYTINTLRGKAWKLFRIIILADLQPTDRISWIDVQYETRFANRLR